MASIVLKNVTVDFPIYGSHRSLRKSILGGAIGGLIGYDGSDKITKIRALEDITLTISHGERVGLIGPNGAGKSTLLRVMAGVYEPTAGSVEVEGRISPLFTTSVGMDPDDTGYENIYNIGYFFGMQKTEVKEKTRDVEQFSELGEFLNLPVRTYSAGMQARLAFAIATAIEPEILLLDEGLGAGDAQFTEKAKKRVDDLIGRPSVFVLASHSDNLIRSMCDNAVYLERGRIITMGGVDEVVESYHRRMADGA